MFAIVLAAITASSTVSTPRAEPVPNASFGAAGGFASLLAAHAPPGAKRSADFTRVRFVARFSSMGAFWENGSPSFFGAGPPIEGVCNSYDSSCKPFFVPGAGLGLGLRIPLAGSLALNPEVSGFGMPSSFDADDTVVAGVVGGLSIDRSYGESSERFFVGAGAEGASSTSARPTAGARPRSSPGACAPRSRRAR